MAGYTRQDTGNNIANGNVIDADDFDAEYNALEAGFNASSGHKHDGSSGEGAPITKVGPAQDVIISSSNVLPKTSNTLDVGSAGAKFKDAFFTGGVNVATVTATGNISVGGNLSVTGNTTIAGNLTFGDAATDTIDFQADVNSNIVPEVTGNFSLGTSTQQWNNLWLDGTANVDTLTVDENATVAGTLVITGVTTATGGVVGNVTGNLTGDVTGDVTGNLTGVLTGNVTGDVTGTVSDVSNHNTGDITEGSNLYHTTARARAAISASGNLSYDNSTGVISLPTDQDVTFDDVVIGGNLTVNGTTTTVNSNTVDIGDNIITLNSDETGTPSQDAGITVERGTSTNKSLVWTESTDKWGVGSETFVAGTFEGALTGNVTGNITGDVTGALTGNASTATALATARNIALAGDVSGNVNFDGTGNVSITTVIADDSHNHTIANVDGLQTEIDTKAELAGSSSQAFSASTLNATTVDLGDWTITESSGTLYFATGGTNKMKLDASGNITAAGNVTAFGTI
mgnify:FL=1|tara:strand:- start:125 stop:1669 length:1545 start_codon:yes stop_codon:yes gene_type:complete